MFSLPTVLGVQLKDFVGVSSDSSVLLACQPLIGLAFVKYILVLINAYPQLYLIASCSVFIRLILLLAVRLIIIYIGC